MKTQVLFIGFFLFLMMRVGYGQNPKSNYEGFEGKGEWDQDIMDKWIGAGASAYKECKTVTIILNAIEDLNLKTSGINSALDFVDSIKGYKKRYINDYLMIYFPSGSYIFDRMIRLSGYNNLIFKGENVTSTSIHIFHPETGIYLEDCYRIGFEDIGIQRDVDGNTKNYDTVGGYSYYLNKSTNCWFSGVYSTQSWKACVFLQNSSHCTITGSTFSMSLVKGDGGEGYGVLIQEDLSQYNLICNNIFYGLRHDIVFQVNNPSYNVIAYNYMDNSVSYNFDLHGRYNGSLGPYKNLIEGNKIKSVGIDRVHGSNGHCNTFFRDKIRDFEVVDYCWDRDWCKYPFSYSDQHFQNAIGCEVTGILDISGTKKYCGGFRKEAWRISKDKKSYFLSSCPDYMMGQFWPYRPWKSQSKTGAENRLINNGYVPGFNTVDPEDWDHYCCGKFAASNMRFISNETLTEYEYKAVATITAGSCTIGYHIPSANLETGVHFIAGNQIEFSPGFNTMPGTVFSANIHDVSCAEERPAPAPSVFYLESDDDEEMEDSAPVSGFKTDLAPLKDALLSVSPNPFVNELGIKLYFEKRKKVHYTIYNTLMQALVSGSENMENGFNEFSLDLHTLSKGTYILNVVSDQFFSTRKIIRVE